MNPVGGSYDESLLREAPVATREQLQEGYNPDLLIAPTRHKSVRQPSPLQSTPPGAAPPALPGFSHGSGLEQGNTIPVTKPLGSYDRLPEKQGIPSSTSFWGTTRGKIVIGVIIALVIIAAVIGGAVGGTAHKKGNEFLGSSSTTVSSAGAIASGGGTNSIAVGTTVTAFPSIPFPISSTSTSASEAQGRTPFPTIGTLPTTLGASLKDFGNRQAVGSNENV